MPAAAPPTAFAGGAAPLLDAVTSIDRTCNLQEISVQRLTEVAASLERIERRLGLWVEALGGERGNPGKSPTIEGGRVDGPLLDGTRMPDNADGRAEIDALLASLD